MTALSGTLPAIRLTARRERLHACAWYLLSGLLLLAIAAGILAAYPTLAERADLAASVDASPGELFLIGPVSSTDVGGVGLWRSQGIAAIFVSLASILTVIRNTRAPEENGTSELLGTAAVGRGAPLAAALAVTAAGSLVTGALVAAGFVALGAALGGSALVGGQIAMFGLLAAAVAALTGQLAQTARAASGLAVASIAVFFLLRGAGDAIGGDAYWMSPLGWIAAVRPFAQDRAAMLLPALGLTLGLAALALHIAARRDLGAGLFADRAGPPHAGPTLRGPISLAVRSSRIAVIGWAVGATMLGVLIGAISSTVDAQIDLELGGTAGGGSGLIGTALYLSPLFAAILGVQIVLRLREEVASGRAEAILSRPVTRTRWLLAHTLAGALASTLMLTGVGLGISATRLGTGSGDSGAMVLAGVLRAPAAWIFIALTALLWVTVPRAAALTFVVLGATQILELAVELHLLPPGALRASPFALAPQLPYGEPNTGQTFLLCLITVVLTVSAATLVRRRDIR